MDTGEKRFGYPLAKAVQLGISLYSTAPFFAEMGGENRLRQLLAEGNETAKKVMAEYVRRKFGLKGKV
jgi:hypothetical protein